MLNAAVVLFLKKCCLIIHNAGSAWPFQGFEKKQSLSQDRPLFPTLALREALVIAFCYRDYLNPGGAVSLAIFDDRLNIWRDETLPFGLKVEDLKRDHQLRPRNPLIAETFFRRGLVERWGRGREVVDKQLELFFFCPHSLTRAFVFAKSASV